MMKAVVWLSPLAWWICMQMCLGQAPRATDADGKVSGKVKHVVLVSVDGLAASYFDDPRAKLPTLRHLAKVGAHADGMITAFPSVTWPAHVSLITGVPPARHGVIGNAVFDRTRQKSIVYIGDPELTKDQAIRVPTLYDVAHAHGLKTASVIWPCCNGAKSLDWIIPDSNKESLHLRYTTPGFTEELLKAGIDIRPLGKWGWDKKYSTPRDELYSKVARYLLDKHQPHLLLVHYITPDGVEHAYGPHTPEAYDAVSESDQRVKEIWDLLQTPAFKDRATLFVVSDHGFAPYEKIIQPNVTLKNLGLIEVDDANKPTKRRAWCVSQGGSAFIYLFDDDKTTSARVKAALAKLPGVQSVLEPEEFMRLGLPHPKNNAEMSQFVLTTGPGHSFGDGLKGAEVISAGGPKGTHGHLAKPDYMHATFLAAGAGIKPGTRLRTVRSIDVAPTIAQVLGLSLPSAEGKVLSEILAEPPVKKQGKLSSDASNAAERIRDHVKILSSDRFEGRGIGTPGEEKTIDYLAEQLAKSGLKPAGERDTFFQPVSLMWVSTGPKATLAATKGNETIAFRLEEQFAGMSKSQTAVEDFDAEAVFVGHGITAPEFGWDDYQGTDVAGKVVVMFTNEPKSDDPKFFGGRALTYYGRWTYRFEEAARRGARAALIIHTNETAGYPFSVVQKLDGAQIGRAKDSKALAFAGWLSRQSGERLLGLSGMTVDGALAAAGTKGFKAVPLGCKVRGHIPSSIRKILTKNVIARVEGSDPLLKDESVIFSAHWDHMGVGRAPLGDAIHNGAIDNGTGCALVLELARQWAALSPRPKRTALFLFTTAEENGLLGAVHYARHPIIPLGKTALNLNFDSIQPMGVPESIIVNGAERTTAWPLVESAARKQGLEIEPDKRGHLGLFYRSDHFALARGGVPAFSVFMGERIKGRPADFAPRLLKEYIDKVYHTPSDEFRDDFDFSGYPTLIRFAIDVGREAANAAELPTWNAGDEFRDARDRSQAK